MSATAVLSALTGGVLALRLVRQVGYVIAVGAGIRIGAAFFDLLPESVDLMGGRVTLAMLFAAIGFIAFYVIEKMTLLHLGHEAATELDHGGVAHQHVGLIGAGAMSVHSLLDGVALGAAFQASPELGFVVGLVVVIHRFSDGIGIVSLLLANRVPREAAMRWVFLVSLAMTAWAELAVPHASESAALAAHQIKHGRYWRWYWWGAIGAGHILPLLLLAAAVPLAFNTAAWNPVLISATLLATVGLYCYEYAFVMAPQEIPNS